jgi:bacillithiol system protein YtxJ
VHLVEEVVQQQIQDILAEDKIMNWIKLEQESQLDQIVALSYTRPQAIFKHSTRCSISTVAKNRLDNSSVDAIDFYYLDLLAFRNISSTIAERFNVYHESPQIILIKNGACIYDESHGGINIQDIVDAINLN